MPSDAHCDWFERLFGFAEGDYDETRSRLSVEGSRLTSKVNGKSYGIGLLELASLQALRAMPAQVDEMRSRLCVGLHWDVEVTDAEGATRPMGLDVRLVS